MPKLMEEKEMNKNPLSKILAYLFLLTCAVTLSILIMIHGWGLTPKSWWWIIGGGVVGHSVIQGLLQLVKRE